MSSEATVLTEIRGRAGLITLNRPEAMNALTHEMVTLIAEALEQWRDDENVDLVIIRGAGDRAFCAGGDVVGLYHDALVQGSGGIAFWEEEYALNLAISQYPKPYVAIMKGYVLGGGVGVSAHGSHRIVTDSTRIGMPETGIGFIPDVGGSHLLANSPDNLGVHLSLTGAHVGAAEALHTGFADFYVPEAELEELVDKLAATGDASLITGADPGEPFDGNVAAMSAAYAGESVEKILANLDATEGEWAAQAAKRIRRNSPTAVKVAWESLRRAQGQTLSQALETELRVSVNSQQGPDFIEGVRAQLVDKDRNPQWRPATLAEVTAEHIEAAFAPISQTTRV